VVLITAFADLEVAIEALRAGASDFLLKPFRVTQVLGAFQRGMERSRLQRENWVLRRTLQQRTPAAHALVGSSIVIKGLQAALQRYAMVNSTVLITGESGTGKELAAQELHRMGPRADAPFVPVNCAAMPAHTLEAELFGVSAGSGQGQRDGLFVYAQGGTLFLDEIGELPAAAQAALLRAIETRRIRPVGGQQEIPLQLRIVAATNRPLRDDVAEGRFRQDLYYRLQVVEIAIPPLRSHKEDIPALVEHFLQTLSPQMGLPAFEITEAEIRFLQEHSWPGNVRELRNLIERSLIVGALNVSALYQGQRPDSRLPISAASPATAPQSAVGNQGAVQRQAAPISLQTLEKRHILSVLESVQGDKTRAAHLLGVSRRTLERRMADWASGSPPDA
jgi:DNA-binding NtrC family response regulator